jgi:tellurite resistance protein
MTEAEAFAAIALAAVAADGKIRQDEASALRKVLEHRRLFSEMSEQAMGNLSIELMQSLESDGVRGLMDRALLKLSPDLQESALAVAAHLVYSDRWVKPQEKEFLNYLVDQVKLPEGSDGASIVRAFEIFYRDTLRD